MARQANNIIRKSINFWEGINSKVASSISKLSELSACENCRADKIGELIKRQGTRRLGNDITATANYGLFYFENDSATNNNFYRISTVSAVNSIYYINTSATWVALTNLGTGLTVTNNFSTTVAENSLFLVNGANNNLYIKGSDGSTVVDSTTSTGHLYNSPKARKINYYKDRLYLGDYTSTTRYKNGIMMSSMPLGIVALLDGDKAISGSTEISVTDTKYIHTSDSLDVYRSGSKIAVITVTAKDDLTSGITGTVAFESGFSSPLLSSDELWVAGTYTGTRIFRWADNPESGTDVKKYDTFKLTGNQNDRIKMLENIGDVMLIGNNNNIAVWNNYNLQNYDIGIGCVSDNGYVKALGVLFFVHYTGLYATTGESAPQLLSNKVERYFTGASKAVLEEACLGRKNQSIFCGLSSTTLYNPDGSIEKTLSNVVLEYNLSTECWYVHTGIKATQFATYSKSADADALEFASTETGYHIYEFLIGQLDDKVTSDKEICFRADTQEITLSSNFEEINYLLEIIVEVSRGSNIECFISLDGEPFYAIEGVARKGVNVLKVTNRDSDREEPPRCRTVKLSFRDSSRKLCKLGKIAIKYSHSLEVEIPTNT